MIKGAWMLMVTILLLAGAALSLALRSTYEARASGYFPPALRTSSVICDGRPQAVLGDVEADWYPQHLIAANEPSLFEASRRPGADRAMVYRLTWLRSFHKPVIARVEQTPGGGLMLTAKHLSGRGGYGPGDVDHRVRRMLTPAETLRFERALAGANRLDLPPVDCRRGADGSQWILEANDAGTYRYVNRWSPTEGPVRVLGDALLDFTGWELAPRY